MSFEVIGKFFKVFNFIDLLEEKVRNRLIYGFIVLLLYLALVLIITSTFYDSAEYPTDVKTIVGIKGEYVIG